MRDEVTVGFQGKPPVRIDLTGAQEMPMDVARWWLDDQFTRAASTALSKYRVAVDVARV